jgi:hypothetical protein
LDFLFLDFFRFRKSLLCFFKEAFNASDSYCRAHCQDPPGTVASISMVFPSAACIPTYVPIATPGAFRSNLPNGRAIGGDCSTTTFDFNIISTAPRLTLGGLFMLGSELLKALPTNRYTSRSGTPLITSCNSISGLNGSEVSPGNQATPTPLCFGAGLLRRSRGPWRDQPRTGAVTLGSSPTETISRRLASGSQTKPLAHGMAESYFFVAENAPTCGTALPGARAETL